VGEGCGAIDEEDHIVDIAVPPVLAGFVGLDEWVMHCSVMGGRVSVRRVVAASDVTARHAHPKVDPLAADAHAVFASRAARRDVGYLIEVTTGLAHLALPLGCCDDDSLG
jgi:hypothetical protein